MDGLGMFSFQFNVFCRLFTSSQDYRIERKWAAVGFCSGAIAGLVAITPGSGYVGSRECPHSPFHLKPAQYHVAAAVLYGFVAGTLQFCHTAQVLPRL